MEVRNLAIACQGGGSHCAFGAGVLMEILARLDDEYCLDWRGGRYRICGLSGTSGGAINALMAWYGLIHPAGPETGIKALIAFWESISATDPADALANFMTVQATRMTEFVPHLEYAPNGFSSQAQLQLEEQIQQQVPFEQLGKYVSSESPKLLVGAADVISGHFKVFAAGPDHLPRPQELVASAAVPLLFPAVRLDGTAYWDGLLSQNPPVRDFLQGCPKDDKPDVMWIIRINPRAHVGIPERLVDIVDRQNEMAGNQSLEQERFFIQQINEWVAQDALKGPFKHVDWHEIELMAKVAAGKDLDYGSKLDRDPAFIAWLIEQGRTEGRAFLTESGGDGSAAENAARGSWTAQSGPGTGDAATSS
jgi:NTE family protein